jgi:hypothetical protein
MRRGRCPIAIASTKAALSSFAIRLEAGDTQPVDLSGIVCGRHGHRAKRKSGVGRPFVEQARMRDCALSESLVAFPDKAQGSLSLFNRQQRR